MEEKKNRDKSLVGKSQGKRPFGRFRRTVYGRIILKWILKTQV
jgi:hypothetical protein